MTEAERKEDQGRQGEGGDQGPDQEQGRHVRPETSGTFQVRRPELHHGNLDNRRVLHLSVMMMMMMMMMMRRKMMRRKMMRRKMMRRKMTRAGWLRSRGGRDTTKDRHPQTFPVLMQGAWTHRRCHKRTLSGRLAMDSWEVTSRTRLRGWELRIQHMADLIEYITSIFRKGQ